MPVLGTKPNPDASTACWGDEVALRRVADPAWGLHGTAPDQHTRLTVETTRRDVVPTHVWSSLAVALVQNGIHP